MSYLLNLIPKEGQISLEMLTRYPQIPTFFTESREDAVQNEIDLEQIAPDERVLRNLLKDVEILAKDCTHKGIEWDIKLSEEIDFERVVKFIFTFAEECGFEVFDPQLKIKVTSQDLHTMLGHQKQYHQGYLIDDNYDPNGASKFLIKFILIIAAFFLIFKLASGCNGLMIDQISGMR